MSIQPRDYAVAAALLLLVVYRWFRKSSFHYLRGPTPEPIFGNTRQVFNGNNVELMLGWKKQFGSVFRYKSLFGQDKLVVSDPKALKYVLNSASYDFPKPEWLRALVEGFSGPNLIWSEGDFHKRQRKVMNPAFGIRETRALFPVFKAHSEKLVSRWHELFADVKEGGSTIIDIHHWMNTVTLNTISEAAFDFDMEREDNELAKMYENFNEEAFPRSNAIMAGVMDLIPTALVGPMFKYTPTHQAKFLKRHKVHVYKVAEEAVRRRRAEIEGGNVPKDVFSLLVKANMAADGSQSKLTDEELLAQMAVIFVAGHDTTASTLTWLLWMLANNVDVQTKLRSELRAAQAQSGSDLTLEDIEGIPYLQAVVKEALRLSPPVFQSSRIASKDSVLPLSEPIETTSGELVQQLHVPKGTEIVVAIGPYQRDRTVWGEDADEFNPERWLNGEQAAKNGTNVGVTSNLLAFLSGTRACIGWRFAMLEMQSLAAEMINNFEFRVEDPTKTVRPWGDNAVYPLVDGELDKGPQMPLRVSIVPRD
ncbi:cytochrome P450 [Heliocybe sulcata]|uniref:Cytochrome P450 n=1 Tax=Heliocybe sulcata TaxID=5364 RepID=A0A5C3MZU9_9AGAM|nr:cytochrome P450 [Heliocybe sulcata]